MTKFALQFTFFMILGLQSALANIQTINAIATGVATTTQALVRGTDPNAPAPVAVQPQAIQPIAPTAQASQTSAPAQQPADASSPATPTTQAPPEASTSPPPQTAATTTAASDPGSSTSNTSPVASTEIATTTAPPPVNVTASSTAPPATGEIQSIEGVYAFGSQAQQELRVKVVIAPKSLGQGKTNLADALEGVTAMVCVGQGNCQYAFPSKAGYFESVLKLPATVKAEEPQTHSVLVFVVACSSLGCVKSKLDTQVQFGA